MKVVPTLILISAFCGVSGVQATEVPTAQVHYADLNLESSAGVQVLYSRLGRAAALVCETYSAPGKDILRSRTYKACIGESLARAVAVVNHPALIRYANEHGSASRERSRLARK